MGTKAVAAGFGAVQAVADAVLYEGYLLYPYRRSSGKNQIRWQFGVLVPRPWAAVHGLSDESVSGSAESWWQQTECLLEAPSGAVVHMRIRFLQLQHRSAEKRGRGGTWRAAGQIETRQRLEMSFDEAVPQEFDFLVPLADLLAGERRFGFEAPGGEAAEPLPSGAGRIVRRRRTVRGTVTVSATRCDAPFRLCRLRVRLENADRTVPAEVTREEALRHSLLASHTLLAAPGGCFVSLLDPPEWAAQAARECRNVHTFPVLAGPQESRDLVLSSPILLYDHPRVAPESPGDLHDATEIDEILCLRTLTLTDDEKAEARATDPRAAAIIDRVGSMPPEIMSRLHGAVRSLRPAVAGQGHLSPNASAAGPDTRSGSGSVAGHKREPVPWWDPGEDPGVSPATDTILVDAIRVGRGDRVRLRPRRTGTDPQDMFLDGRTAVVEAVLLDVDGSHHLAVTVDDDPAADLNQWYGRYRYFSPGEVEPLPGGREPS